MMKPIDNNPITSIMLKQDHHKRGFLLLKWRELISGLVVIAAIAGAYTYYSSIIIINSTQGSSIPTAHKIYIREEDAQDRQEAAQREARKQIAEEVCLQDVYSYACQTHPDGRLNQGPMHTSQRQMQNKILYCHQYPARMNTFQQELVDEDRKWTGCQYEIQRCAHKEPAEYINYKEYKTFKPNFDLKTFMPLSQKKYILHGTITDIKNLEIDLTRLQKLSPHYIQTHGDTDALQSILEINNIFSEGLGRNARLIHPIHFQHTEAQMETMTIQDRLIAEIRRLNTYLLLGAQIISDAT